MSSAICEHINLEKGCSVATPLLYNMKYGLSSNQSKLFTEDRSICHLPTALVKLLLLKVFLRAEEQHPQFISCHQHDV